MIAARPGFSLTLAIHPNSKGFGWIAFENGTTPYDWGTVRVRKDKNATCLERAEKLLDRLSPETLVLEAAEPTNSRRKGRITKLVRALTALALLKGISVETLTVREVQECFAVVGAQTRQEIAELVARQFSVLSPRLPMRRRPWETEREELAIFVAASLIVTFCEAKHFVDFRRSVNKDRLYPRGGQSDTPCPD